MTAPISTGAGADLGDRQDEHQHGEDGREGHAGDRQPDPRQPRLHDGGDDDPERHAANRLRGEMHGVLALRAPASRRAKRSAARAAVSPFAYRIAAMITVSRNWTSSRPTLPT